MRSGEKLWARYGCRGWDAFGGRTHPRCGMWQSVDAVLNLGLRFHHRGCSTLTCHTVRCFEVVIAACVDAGIPIKRIQFTMKYCAVVWGVTKASIRRVHRQVARGFAMYKVRVPDALARQAQPNDAAASAEPSPSSDAADLANDVPAVSPRPEVTTPPSPPKVAPAWLDTPSEPQPPVLPGSKPRHSPGGGIASTVPESGATAAVTARSDAPEDIMAPYPSRPEDDAVSVESDWTPRFGEEIQRTCNQRPAKCKGRIARDVYVLCATCGSG